MSTTPPARPLRAILSLSIASRLSLGLLLCAVWPGASDGASVSISGTTQYNSNVTLNTGETFTMSGAASIVGGSQFFLSNTSLTNSSTGGITGGTQTFSAGDTLDLVGSGFISGGTQNFFGAGSNIYARSANAVRGGTQTLTSGATYHAMAASALSAATINVYQDSVLKIEAADATTANVNLNFDSQGFPSGGTLNLNGFSTTVGLIQSGDPASVIASGNAATLTVNFDTVTSAFSGTLQGAMSIVKAGTGTLRLLNVGDNSFLDTDNPQSTYTGSTTVSGGTLVVNTLSIRNNNVTNNANLTFDQSPSNDFTGTDTYGGVISGSGNFTKTGSGTLTLSGANSFTGVLTVNQGTLIQTSGATKTNSSVVVGSGAQLLLGGTTQNGIGIRMPVTVQPGGRLTMGQSTNNVQTLGVVNLDGGTLDNTTAADPSFGHFYLDGTTINVTQTTGTSSTISAAKVQLSNAMSVPVFNVGSGALLTVSSTLSDAFLNTSTGVYANTGGIVKTGAGVLKLTGTNIYSGGTAINGGLINFTATNNFGSGTVTFNGGGLQWATGTTLDITSVAQYNHVLGANGGVFDTNGNNVNFGTALSGGSLTKLGAGMLTLAVANTYTGGTTIGGGTLRLSNANSIGTSGTISFTGGALQSTSSNTTDYSARFSTAANQQFSLDTNGQNITLNSVLASTGGTLTKSGTGDLTLTQPNTFDGVTRVAAGRLVLTTGLGLQNSTLDLNSADTGVFGVTNVVTALTLGALQGSRNYDLRTLSFNQLTLTVGGNNASTTYSGGLSNGTAITKTGTGVWTLSGSNSFNSVFNLNGGGLVVSGSLGPLLGLNAAAGTSITVPTGGTLSLRDTLSLDGTAAKPAALNITGGQVTNYHVYVGNTGVGTAVQSGGALTATSYNLNLGYGGGSSGSYTLGAGATISVFSLGVGYSGAGTFLQNGGTVTTTGSTGLLLGENGGATGSYTMNGGTINCGGYLTLGASGGTATFLQNGGSVNITGSGFFQVFGGSSYTLSGSTSTLTYAGSNSTQIRGTMTQNAGTFTSANAQIGVSGSYYLNGGTVAAAKFANLASAYNLYFNGGTLQAKSSDTSFLLSATIQAGGASIDTNGFNIGVQNFMHDPAAGAPATDGGLTKMGPGSLSVTGANTYTGSTSVQGGTFLADNTTGSATGSGAVTVQSTATLGGTGTISGSLNISSGASLAPGDTGPGRLKLGSDLNLSSGSSLNLEVNSAVAATGYDQVTLSGPLSLNGALHLTLAPGYTPALNQVFTILLNSGSTATSGAFSNLSGNTYLEVSGYAFTVNSAANMDGGPIGNDVTLTYAGVPEPSPALLSLLGTLLIPLRRRRSRRRENRAAGI